jgi:hypothetical protein
MGIAQPQSDKGLGAEDHWPRQIERDYASIVLERGDPSRPRWPQAAADAGERRHTRPENRPAHAPAMPWASNRNSRRRWRRTASRRHNAPKLRQVTILGRESLTTLPRFVASLSRRAAKRPFPAVGLNVAEGWKAVIGMAADINNNALLRELRRPWIIN